ncbi:MAG: SPOR domain-containing protein [Magnetococcales bacterium]|nr:SPOR domain-containing protein [Magnetococcales bacterium]
MFASVHRNLFAVFLLTTTLFSCRFALPPPTAGEYSGSGGQRADASSLHLTLLTEPADAKVEILNLEAPYQPNMAVKPGIYHMVVSAPGYKTVKGYITISDQDWVGKVVLSSQTAAAEVKGQEPQNLQQEQERLAEARRLLSQEQEQITAARQKLEAEQQALLRAKKEWEAQQNAGTAPRGGQAADGAALPAKRSNPLFSWFSAASSAAVVGKAPAAKVDPAESTLQQIMADSDKKVGSSSADSASQQKAVTTDSQLPEQSAPKEATAPQESVDTLLDEVMLYLQLEPADHDNLASASEEALRKLRQAQEREPDNTAVKRALQMYDKRYIIRVGSFKQLWGANDMEERVRSLGIPAFQQSWTEREEPVYRVAIGPFPERKEADQNLAKLKRKIKVGESILRIYRK